MDFSGEGKEVKKGSSNAMENYHLLTVGDDVSSYRNIRIIDRRSFALFNLFALAIYFRDEKLNFDVE